MLQSVSQIPDASSTLDLLHKNKTAEIYEFSCFQKFIDFFRRVFTGQSKDYLEGIYTGKSTIDAHREIHELLFSKHVSSSDDLIGENFKPILGVVKMLDITKENQRDLFKVSVTPRSDECFEMKVCFHNKILIEKVVSSNELSFLEKTFFNKNNGAVTYPVGAGGNSTFENLFLSAYKDYVQQTLEKTMQEIIVNVNDIIMHSSTRDIERKYEKDKPRPVPDSAGIAHGKFIEMARGTTDDFGVTGINIQYVLKYNTGNCGEMAMLSAVLLNCILEKTTSSFSLNACNSIDVSVLSTPRSGEDGYSEGCDHFVANLKFNSFGKGFEYVVDSWGGCFFKSKCCEDIKNNYSKGSYFTNENIQLRTHDILTDLVNDEDYIAMIKKDIYKIHKVNLDDASFTDPFKQERNRREMALANRFSHSPSM